MKTTLARLLRKAVLFGSLVSTLLPIRSQAEELRAVWVDAFGNGFLTASQVTQLVNDCRTYNFNAVVVQMRRRGDAFYIPQAPNGDPRTTALASGYDALQEIINQCHSGSPRIEVHCWVPANLIWSSGTPTQPGHVFNLHPDFLSKSSGGNTQFAEGYYLDPGHPDAMMWNYNVAKDIVSRYDIDGFHWDYIRYPQQDSGYNTVAITRYNAEFGLTGQPSSTSSQFSTWRRRQITDFVRWTSADLLEIKPNLMISASVFANRTDATSFRFQDWSAWANEGIIDFLMPMNYTTDNSTFSSRLNDIFTHQGIRRAYIGLGAYLNTKENTTTQLGLARAKPFLGTSLFSYRTPNSGAVDQNATFQFIKDNYQPSWEDAPILPWIANPTKAIIKGTITRQSDSAAVYNAMVSVSTTPGKTQRTEPHGKYAFFEVDPGTYTVTASSSGFTNSSAAITVSAGGIYNVDLAINLPLSSDTTPPIISAVGSSLVTSNAATITWTTDEASDSTVEYGITTAYGSSANDGSLETSHSISLGSLSAGTVYNYRVKSTDAAGNEAVSGNFQFTTAPAQPDIIVDNPNAQVIGAWTIATSAADKFGTNYANRTFGTGINSLLFRPNVPVTGNYQVFEWHSQGANRATNTPVIVTSSGGVSTNRVNQQINGGKWNYIGTFSFNAGTNGTIRISDAATGPAGAQVIADAIKLTYLPDAPPAEIIIDNTAAVFTGPWSTGTGAGRFDINYRFRGNGTGANFGTYTPSIAVAGDYQIFEWHPAGANRPTNAPHVITFNGGVVTNRINQQINGGKWNLLGTYNFTVGTSGNVKITDAALAPTAISPQVMADALRFVFVPPPAPPAVPGGVIASAFSSSQINVTWTDNSTNEASFIIARSATSGGPYTDVGTVAANTTSFSNTGLTADTTYHYVVRALGSGGSSAHSTEGSATTFPPAPQAPNGLVATAISASQIDLQWIDNDGGSDLSFVISRGTSLSGPFADIGDAPSQITTFSDTGLTPLTTYYYAVRARNSGGDSANSDVASATTLSDIPAAPTGLAGVAVSATQIELTWIDNANNEDSVAVIRAPLNGTYSTIATLPADTTSFVDATVSAHTTYFYYLRVANAAGNSVSSAIEVTTPNSSPVANAGTDLNVSANGSCQATVVLDGSGSNDPDQDTLSYTWSGAFGTAIGASPTVSLGLGTHLITLTVDDGFGGTASATVTVTVNDTTAPILALNGSASITVECHGAFADDGATASDACGGDLTSAITVAGSVDANTTGVYILTYTVADPSGNTVSVTRTVNVIDTTAPVLTLNGPASVTVECHTGFTDEGAIASDLCAGDLTSSIAVSGSVDANAPGTYTLTYSVSDASGNTASAVRTVSVVDTTAPTLSLVGAASMTVECHSFFADPGAEASDTCAGDLSESITVSGSVDANSPGVYTLTYAVIDPSGNTATAVRTVTVVDTTAPEVASADASPSVLWPPNNKMVPVTVSASALDACDSTATTRIVSVSSNDGNSGDWQILSATTVNLRAEKAKKTDRIYIITVEAVDAAGNTSTREVTVTVPHDQGNGN